MKIKVVLGFLMAAMMLILPLAALSVSDKSFRSELSDITSKAQDNAGSGGTSASSQASSQVEEKASSIADFKTDSFRILDLSANDIITVSAFNYVVGAVASEMPYTYHEEAIKAQAVSAYTYALKVRNQNLKSQPENLKGADFSADPSKYLGFMTEEIAKERFGSKFDEIWQKITNAVSAVFGEVIIYKNEPIIAAYHALSSGKTESAENVWGQKVEYLVPVDSEFDKNAEDYTTTETFTLTQVTESLNSKFSDITLPEDKTAWFNILKRSESGTVLDVTVGSMFLTGNDVRNLFGLRSANFAVSFADDVFTFTVTGYGHGVGLSQQGANAMANEGKNYKEILTHYYSGVEIIKI